MGRNGTRRALCGFWVSKNNFSLDLELQKTVIISTTLAWLQNQSLEFKTMTNDTEISQKLNLIKKGEIRNWAQIADVLISVQQQNAMQSEVSFTEWLNSFAKELKKTEALLWRWMAAAKNYKEFMKLDLEKIGIDAPDLQNLPNSISAENIELLFKIKHAISNEMVVDFEKRILEGDIQRAELRGIYVALRTEQKKYPNHRDMAISNQFIFKTKLFSCLMNKKLTWLDEFAYTYVLEEGHRLCKRETYRTLFNINVPFFKYEIDAITIAYKKPADMLKINGFIIFYSADTSFLKKIEQLMTCSDCIWVATKIEDLCHLKNLPEEVGIVTLDDNDEIIINVRAKDRYQFDAYDNKNIFRYRLIKKLLLQVL